MSYPIDLTNMCFGNWSVIGNGARLYKAKCVCGRIKTVRRANLIQGNSQGCGCVRYKKLADRNRTHGMSLSYEYHVWGGMKSRCSNIKQPGAKNYAKKGIRVCTRWLQSFQHFLDDMGPAPSTKHSIERMDGNGDYEPKDPKKQRAGQTAQLLRKRSLER